MPNIHETVAQLSDISAAMAKKCKNCGAVLGGKVCPKCSGIKAGGPGSGRKPGMGNKFTMTPAQHKMHTQMSKKGYTKIGGLSKEGHAVYQRPNGTQKHVDQQGNIVKTKFLKDRDKEDLI